MDEIKSTDGELPYLTKNENIQIDVVEKNKILFSKNYVSRNKGKGSLDKISSESELSPWKMDKMRENYEHY